MNLTEYHVFESFVVLLNACVYAWVRVCVNNSQKSSKQ